MAGLRSWLRGRPGREFTMRGRRDRGAGACGLAGRTRRDRGSSAIELAILAPMLLAMIWLTIQYALYYQGRQVALAAAQLGARVASQDADAVPGWAGLADQSAENYYHGLGTRVLGRVRPRTGTGNGDRPGGVHHVRAEPDHSRDRGRSH